MRARAFPFSLLPLVAWTVAFIVTHQHLPVHGWYLWVLIVTCVLCLIDSALLAFPEADDVEIEQDEPDWNWPRR